MNKIKKSKVSMCLALLLIINLIFPTMGFEVKAKDLICNEIKVRVEGTNKTLFDKQFEITNEEVVKDVIKNSIGEDNVDGLESNFITGVLGEKRESHIGWMYYLIDKDGNIKQGDVISNEKIKDINNNYYKELVLHMAKWSDGITCVPKVTYSNVNNNYTLKITEQNMMMGIDERNAKDVNIKVDGVGEYKTDENGQAAFKIKCGENKVHIYKTLKDSKGVEYPAIVRQSFTLTGDVIDNDVNIAKILDDFNKNYENQELNYKKLLALNYYNEVNRTDFMLEESDNASSYASNIMGILALSENPYNYKEINYVEKLLKSQDNDGEFVVSENDKGSATTLASCIIALDMAKADFDKNKAVKTLINKINDSGFEDIDIITNIMIALSKHRDIEGVNDIINLSIEKLKEMQLEGGGFDYCGFGNSPYSTGPAIQALISVGENLNSEKWNKGRTPIEALLACKIEGKGFEMIEGMGEGEDDETATELALLALVDAYKEKSVYSAFAFIKEEPKDYNKIIESELNDINDYFKDVKEFDYNAMMGLSFLSYDKNQLIENIKLKDKENVFNLAQNVMSIITMEKDPKNYNGKNYIDLLYDKLNNDKFTGKSIYGLIALEMSSTKKEYIDTIISKFKTEFNNNKVKKISDKSLLIIALSPYKEDDEVKSIINKCVEDLKNAQLENAAFTMNKAFPNGESEDTALAIEAIIASGGDPLSEEWTKNGKNPLDALLSFKMGKGYIYESSLGAYEQNMYTGYVLRSIIALKNKTVVFNNFKLDEDEPVEKNNKLTIENNIIKENFLKGHDANIELKLNNKNNNSVENVTIIIGVFNKNNKLISYKTLENTLENGEIKDIKEKISLPNEDNLKVKIFTWDSLEKMNSKNEPIEIKVKN
ncbi:surface/cell-adhesion protein [Clostridium senegalense]|uniref:surface/cell-adhesion protein n=1 Tax=Clostridium senegalense TaxID=1465809 RepID=UPI000287CB84|nr:surface/cell-adhesion protein [Clostridium senegalense]